MLALLRGTPSIPPLESGSDNVYLAHGAAADIWIVSSTQRPKHILKVIRVNPERLRRHGANGGSSSQSSNNIWKNFVKEYDARVAAWSSLSHANVVRIFGTGSELNLEVEYYENGCVRDYLKSHSLTVDKVAMILDVLAGMEYLHQHSPAIVHGSVNAGKLFVDGNGKTAVGEFGLAGLCYPFAAYAPSVSFTGLTRWFGPELLDDDADHVPQSTLASDVWALGCTLYEILAETLPYSNYRHEIKVQRAIIAGEPPGRHEDWLEASHHGFLWPIIESCWTPAPENRPNISKLAGDVRACSSKNHSATSVEIPLEGRPVTVGSGDQAVWVKNPRTIAALFESLTGHSDSVALVAISSEGRCIISGSWDRTVRAWDAQAGAALPVSLQGYSGWVICVAISSDGQRIVSGSDDGTVRIWDAHTGATLLEPLRGHSGRVTFVAVSSDGRQIVSDSLDKTARIWDAQTGAVLLEPLQGHLGPVKSVAISFGGRRIASGSSDRAVRRRDAHTGAALFDLLRGYSGTVVARAISQRRKELHDLNQKIKKILTDRPKFKNLDKAEESLKVLKSLQGLSDQTSSSMASISLVHGTLPKIRRFDMAVAKDPTHPVQAMVDPIISSSLSQSIAGMSPQPSSSFDETGARPAGLDVTNSVLQIVTMMGGDMPVSDIITGLSQHGFRNLTGELGLSSSSSHALSIGMTCDVFCSSLRDGTRVAVKTNQNPIGALKAENERLTRMARGLHAWSKCEHPNVARLLGLAEFRGQIATVSLWMDNGDLPTHVNKYPNVDRLKLCIQVANGVTYLHSIGIIHGGLQGSNVLISREGTAVVNDFSNAVSVESGFLIERSRQDPARWLAPELSGRSDKPCSPETDVFALGMLILEAFTGKVPHPEKRGAVGVITTAMKDNKPARPQHIPADRGWGDALWDLLMRCWSLNPQERPTATVAHNHLQAISAMRYPTW